MKAEDKVYTIPLGKTRGKPTGRRSSTAVKEVQDYLKKHSNLEDVRLDSSINEYLYRYGKGTIPKNIKIKVTLEDDVPKAILVD